jgi:C_GCAxxG_C_C family probable redox protein
LHTCGVKNILGIDISPGMVAQAQKLNPGLTFHQGDMLRLDVENNAWAGIAAFYSIIHIPHDKVLDALREMRRVLKPGGLLLLTFHIGQEVIHLDDWWGNEVSINFFLFTTTEMTENLASAGFEIKEIVERDPYPNVEAQTRRAYVLAQKPNRRSITMSQKSQRAVSCFSEGFSCAQAVLSIFGPEMGVDRETALRVAGMFGGGMGHMGQVCGAVTGAFMALGLKYGKTRQSENEKQDLGYARVRQFAEEFTARNGSIICKELLGHDLSTPEGAAQAREKGLFSEVCPKLVQDAVEILEQMEEQA